MKTRLILWYLRLRFGLRVTGMQNGGHVLTTGRMLNPKEVDHVVNLWNQHVGNPMSAHHEP